MKKLIPIVIILTLLIFLTSCKIYVVPAVLGHNIGYVPKPMVADSIRAKTYISGGLGASADLENEISFRMGMLNINRSHTYKKVNFSYGAFGYFGSAAYNKNNTNQINTTLSNFNKNTGGLGIRTSIGLNNSTKSGNLDFRILSWENALSTEMGSYANFRTQLHNNTYSNTYVSNLKTIWTTGFAT